MRLLSFIYSQTQMGGTTDHTKSMLNSETINYNTTEMLQRIPLNSNLMKLNDDSRISRVVCSAESRSIRLLV